MKTVESDTAEQQPVTKTHSLFPLFSVASMKTNSLDRHKIVFLYQQGDSQRAISCKLGISQHGVQCVLKTFEETGQVEEIVADLINYLQQMNSI